MLSVLLGSTRFAPPPSVTGHGRARHYFDLVQRYMGLNDRQYDLLAQRERFNPGSSIGH